MNRKVKAADIEARLHRSLTNQVRAPKLERRFDAGVWARIEAEEHAPAPVSQHVVRNSKVALWLMASDVVGLAVAGMLALFFGLRMFNGIDFNVALPDLPAAQNQQIAGIVAWAITAAALGFGVMFTPIGRRLRAEFS
jgi:negative regulator of sigma E activity